MNYFIYIILLLSAANILSASEKFESYIDACNLAQEDMQYEEYKKAVENFMAADRLAKSPQERYRARYYAAEALLRAGNPVEANEMLKSILALKELGSAEKAGTLLRIGNFYQQQKKNAEAVAAYEKAFELAPEHAAGWNALRQAGMIHFHAGNYDAALEKFQLAVKNPSCPAAIKATAMVDSVKTLIRQKKYAEAEKWITDAEKTQGMTISHIVQLRNEQAEILLNRNLPDEALKLHEETLKLSALSPDWQANVLSRIAGIYFHQKKDVAKAKEYIDRSNAVKGASWGKNKYLTAKITKTLKK